MKGKVLAVLAETIDEIGKHKRLGGPAYYSSLTLLSLGAEFDALLTGNVMRTVLEYSGYTVNTFCGHPTTFRFISTEPRLLRLLNRCFNSIRGLPYEDYEVALISLTMGEAPLTDIDMVAEHTETLVIDAQGFVRDIGEDGVVFNNKELAARLFQAGADIQERGTTVVIKASHNELPHQSFVEKFIESGGILIVTRGGELVTLSTKIGCWLTKPPQVIGDPTGAGDVMLAALTTYLASGHDIRRSLLLGVAAGSIRLAKKEPPWILWSEIESLARRLRLVECDSIGDSAYI